MHQDSDSVRYTTDEHGTVVDHAADELALLAAWNCPTKLLPHITFNYTNLEPLEQAVTPLKKLWCVKIMDDTHDPEIFSRQLNVIKTYLKARYRLPDFTEFSEMTT